MANSEPAAEPIAGPKGDGEVRPYPSTKRVVIDRKTREIYYDDNMSVEDALMLQAMDPDYQKIIRTKGGLEYRGY